MADSDRYVRLDEEGNITEPYVLEVHIKNRAHPLDWYTPVKYDVKPVIPEYCGYKEVLTVSEDKSYVLVSYTSFDYDLDYLFLKVKAVKEPDSEEATLFGNPTEVTQVLIDRIKQLTVDRLTEKLDVLANQRSYKNIEVLAGYSDDEDDSFSAEGTYGKKLRSQVWRFLYAYYDKIVAGTIELSVSYDDLIIAAGVPDVTWDAYEASKTL